MTFEDIGEAADFVVQFLIGDVAAVFRVVAFPDDRGLVGPLREMTINAIHRNIGGAVAIPFDMDIAGGVRGVLDLRVGFDPVDALAFLAPEFHRILDRCGIHFKVAGIVDVGALRPFGCYRIHFLGHVSLPTVNARLLADIHPHVDASGSHRLFQTIMTRVTRACKGMKAHTLVGWSHVEEIPSL